MAIKPRKPAASSEKPKKVTATRDQSREMKGLTMNRNATLSRR